MSLRTLILHNFWLKLFSIALATVIWLAIHYSIHDAANENQTLTPHYILVPVSVKKNPGDKFRITPDEVVVTAVGKDPVLFLATQKEIRINLDLTGFKGTESTSEKLRGFAPEDIIVLEILPSAVEVQKVSP